MPWEVKRRADQVDENAGFHPLPSSLRMKVDVDPYSFV